MTEDKQVTLEISIHDTDTTFMTFDGGGTAKVEDIKRESIVVIGDNPLPNPLERYEEETDEPYSWKAVLPKEEKGVWSAFINSIQTYNR